MQYSEFTPAPTDIAIVGMAARVPGANNPGEFWKNVRDGVESVRTLSADELLAAGVPPDMLAQPNYVRAAARLDDVAGFDAAFFGFSNKDAAIMDPQHRHFLECCWEALEDAGHVPERFSGSIGVFGGCGMNAYFMFNLLTNRKLMESTGLFLVRHTGNDKDFLCTRVSYQLNLRGPSVSVQTACSTSLVAIHTACQSLLSGECDMALAGGVTIELPHGRGYLYEEGEILSHDGHCRSFDAESTGTVFGSGAGVVVLRRAQDALDSHDNILAVIRGSAINNDGAAKVGYLAPGVEGQAAVYREALSVSGVDAETISYIEAHGTGTRVGDPIEVEALSQAFRRFTNRTGFCALGSVKSNIGHLDTAAGVIGLIKVVQALRHRQLPPSLHFKKPNPLISFPDTPFFVNAELRDWVTDDQPRRAGVSSLGVGGTNAHVILEEGPAAPEKGAGHPEDDLWQILPVSGRTVAALDMATDRLAEYFRGGPAPLADVAFTLQEGRKSFGQRRAIVCRAGEDIARNIDLRHRQSTASGAAVTSPSVVFLFPGGGAQHPGMGAGLYDYSPLYRAAMDEGFRLYQAETGRDLKRWLYPSEEDAEAARSEMEHPLTGLPALFLTQYALGRLWMHHGVTPAAMVGHSLGAYAEACLAGVMTMAEGLSIVITRARLFESLPEGAMLSVPLPAEELRPLLGTDLSMAAINSPGLCVASGAAKEIEALRLRLLDKGAESHRVHIQVAAHSHMLDPILDEFRTAVGRLNLQAPAVPFLSSFKGTWATAAEVQSAGFWTDELRHTVRFSSAIRELLAGGPRIFVEIGPGHTLTNFASDHPGFTSGSHAVRSMRHGREEVPDVPHLLHALARVWTLGVDLNWKSLRHGHAARRVSLPTYPWEHQQHWIEAGEYPAAGYAQGPAEPAAAAKPDSEVSEWFQRVEWRRAPSLTGQLAGSGPWLLFGDESELTGSIREQLRAEGELVTVVHRGERFAAFPDGSYSVRIDEREDYSELFERLDRDRATPRRIVHLWSRCRESFAGLLILSQVLGERGPEPGCQLAVVTRNLQPVGGEPVKDPVQALSLGIVRVLPREQPEIACLAVDVDETFRSTRTLLQTMVAENASSIVCAIRGGERWVETFASIAGPMEMRRPRSGGVFLITGGLGGIALHVARALAGTGAQPKLVLLGRSVSATDGPHVRRLEELKELGAEVMTVTANVTDHAQMQQAVAAAKRRFGAIHGVIHAAGILDDGPLQLKSREAAERVLQPKVEGTLVLERVLRGETLDFFILFSSVSSYLGLGGQVDYTAANAFLDAFAASRPGVRVLNWSRWEETGMTRSRADGEAVALCAASMWELAEHRLRDGVALLPGSAYFELALRALSPDALRPKSGGAAPVVPIQIRNLFFLHPLSVPEGRTVQAHIRLTGSAFGVYSETSGEREDHAQAEVSLAPETVPGMQDLGAIRLRCRRKVIVSTDAPFTRQGEFIEFGPRWNVLRSVRFGNGEALAELHLPPEFHGDLLTHPLHPAMLDWATSAGLPMAPGYQADPCLHVPISYESVVIFAPLPAAVVSHIRLRDPKSTERDAVAFDIAICDPHGLELISIRGFTLRRIDPNQTGLEASSRVRDYAKPEAASLELASILPPLGAEAFLRVLSLSEPRQILISPVSMNRLVADSRPVAQSRAVTTPIHTESGDEIENWLLRTCSELLGIPRMSAKDDFFALGGHSLIAIRLFLKIKKTYRLELGLATLFEARTMEQLAALIRQRTAPADVTTTAPVTREWSPVVRVQAGTGDYPPVFLVHGNGGNVVNFEPLVRRLGSEYTIYAIQCLGVEGDVQPLHSIEEMAERYIAAVRKLHPRGPYSLLGYSFGGLICFEMARRLRAAGEDAPFLGMLDTFQHSYLEVQPPNPILRWRPVVMAGRIPVYFRHLLMEPNRIDFLCKRFWKSYANLSKAGMLPKSLRFPARFREQLLDAFNSAAAYLYQPKPYSGRIVLFRALERNPGETCPRHLGWEGLAAEGVEIVDVPGNHATMGEEPHVAALANGVRPHLARRGTAIPAPGRSSHPELQDHTQGR